MRTFGNIVLSAKKIRQWREIANKINEHKCISEMIKVNVVLKLG